MITIAQTLWRSPVEQAAAQAAANAATGTLDDVDTGVAAIEGLAMPLGWTAAHDGTEVSGDPRHVPASVGSWALKVLGLAITAFALAFGAPFWRDDRDPAGHRTLLRAGAPAPVRAGTHHAGVPGQRRRVADADRRTDGVGTWLRGTAATGGRQVCGRLGRPPGPGRGRHRRERARPRGRAVTARDGGSGSTRSTARPDHRDRRGGGGTVDRPTAATSGSLRRCAPRGAAAMRAARTGIPASSSPRWPR